MVGGYCFKQETDYYSYQDLRYINAATRARLARRVPAAVHPARPDARRQAKAAFANINWEIVPGLTFDGGLRYTDESKHYHYFRLNPDGTINAYLDPVGAANGAGSPGALTGLVARYKRQSWDWRAALNYRFSPDGDGLCEHLDRLQGRRHQPAAVLRQPGDPFAPRC